MTNPFLFEPGRGNPVALSDDRRISWQEFLSDLAGVTGHLRRTGGKTGILLTEDAYWGIVGLLAMTAAGLDVILPPNGQAANLAALAGQSDIFVCDGHIAALHRDLPRKMVLGADMMAALPENPVFRMTAGIAFFTSGSSSARKRCEKSLSHLVAEAHVIDRLLGNRAPLDCDVLGTVSHQHAYGSAFRMVWPFLSGRRMVGRMHHFTESLFHELRHRAVVVSSPAHLTRLEGIAELPQERAPSVVLSAGGVLSDDAAAAAMGIFHIPVTDIYGSTEAGAMAFRDRDGPQTWWQPLPGTVIGPGSAGELRARAHHIPPEGELNADRMEMGGDGRFQLLGRSDRVAKIEGKRISLPEIEMRLAAMEEVKSATVMLLDEAQGLCAAVVPTELGWKIIGQVGTFRFGRRLRTYLTGWIDTAGLPRRWRFLKHLPTSDMGKVSRADLARYFDAGSP